MDGDWTMEDKKLHKYSGPNSKEFWDRVNALEEQHDELYSLGVALQNLEGYILKTLKYAEDEQSHKKHANNQASLSDSGEATDCSNYPACKHACGDELIKSGCNSDCPYYGVAEPKSSLKLACNTPNCPTKEGGMELMEHPGTNKQTYKCPRCECGVLVITEQSPQQPSISEGNLVKRMRPENSPIFKNVKDWRQCASCNLNTCDGCENMRVPKSEPSEE